MSFGSDLITLRKSRGLSRAELARLLEIPYTTLRNYETDQREPGHKLLIALSSVFSVSVDELIGNVNYTKKSTTILDIEQQYGKSTSEAVSMYVQLDVEDQGEIRGEMKQMLRAEKYHEKESSAG